MCVGGGAEGREGETEEMCGGGGQGKECFLRNS